MGSGGGINARLDSCCHYHSLQVPSEAAVLAASSQAATAQRWGRVCLHYGTCGTREMHFEATVETAVFFRCQGRKIWNVQGRRRTVCGCKPTVRP